MGERGTVNDLMAWNLDATRMPYRMHAEYLRHLFLDNDLAEGRFPVDGRPVSLTDIRAPIFAVGTVSDHVAPWRSAFKIRHLTDTEVTFALTTGGHNAGIVSARDIHGARISLPCASIVIVSSMPTNGLPGHRTSRVRGGRAGSCGLMRTRAIGWHRPQWGHLRRDSNPSAMRREPTSS